MTSVTTIGLDIAKNIFQVYAGGISRTVCPSAPISFPAAGREYKLLAEMRGSGQPKSLNYR